MTHVERITSIVAKTTKSSLCDYSGAYILVKETITITNTEAVGAATDNNDKQLVF